MLRHANISFPLDGLNNANTLAWASDNQSVRDVIWNILLTRPGERLMRPEFGAGLRQFIHHPNNETTRRLIADVAIKAITRWERRIDLLALNIVSEPAQLNQIVLHIHYRLKANGQQTSLDFGLTLQS